jgi:hypothetical protein
VSEAHLQITAGSQYVEYILKLVWVRTGIWQKFCKLNGANTIYFELKIEFLDGGESRDSSDGEDAVGW